MDDMPDQITAESLASHERRLPVGLWPNRRQSSWLMPIPFSSAFIRATIGIWVVLFVAANLTTVASIAFPPITGFVEVNVSIIVYLGMCLLFLFVLWEGWKEFNYQSGDGRWRSIVLSTLGVTVPTTFRRRYFPWSEIERFVVSPVNLIVKQIYMVRANGKQGSWFRDGVSIPQEDFAKGVGINDAVSAEVLCGFLNQVRRQVHVAKLRDKEVIISVPEGLKVFEQVVVETLDTARPANRTPTVTRD